MSEGLLDTVEVCLGEPVRAAVIWLHGLGADGHDFEPVVPRLGLAADAGIRFVFPHAPVRPVTVNGGMPMRAWYDIAGIGPGYREDLEGLDRSAAAVRALVARESARGVPPGAIVLAGFSQGGAVALHTAVRHPAALAGVMALSTYLPGSGRLPREATAASRATPILMVHGRRDPVVPFELGEAARDALEAAGYRVEWHAFDMGHEVIPEELRLLGRWLGRVLAGGGREPGGSDGENIE